ncbi:MAG TPA: CvpA family protein [Pseudomonadales bacterium]|nr:CvpA family protein [Pseudomonadales bacterium]
MMLAASTQSFSMDNLPVNWFDGTLLVILCFGLFRGRKNGMTKEVIPTIEWICVVVAGAFAYPLVAQFFSSTCGLGQAWSGSLGYFAVAMVVFIIFSFIKKALMPRLEGSNIFGSAEYYLGMPSGMVRYACIVLFFLSLMNAPVYTAADIAATKAYNEKWYGGGMYSGNYVPDFQGVQEAVFKKSFTGPYIAGYAGMMLVQTDATKAGATQTAKAAPQKAQPIIHIGN